MLPFRGDLKQVKLALTRCGYVGQWASLPKDGFRFRAYSGEILNWWPKTGSMHAQGRPNKLFEQALTDVLHPSFRKKPKKHSSDAAKIIFITGACEEVNWEVRLMLGRLGLKLFIANGNQGLKSAIAEAKAKPKWRRSVFGIVLLTPDPFDEHRSKQRAGYQPCVPQNVILELGMLMATLGEPRMLILESGGVERPSKAAGITRIEFNDHPAEGLPELVSRLEDGGFEFTAKQIAAASGDLNNPQYQHED